MLYSVGAQLSTVRKSGRKSGRRMTVQPTSIMRRQIKHSVRGVSTYGRKHRDVAKRIQMNIDENTDDGVLSQTMPPRKKVRMKKKQNLSESVSRNVPHPPK